MQYRDGDRPQAIGSVPLPALSCRQMSMSDLIVAWWISSVRPRLGRQAAPQEVARGRWNHVLCAMRTVGQCTSPAIARHQARCPMDELVRGSALAPEMSRMIHISFDHRAWPHFGANQSQHSSTRCGRSISFACSWHSSLALGSDRYPNPSIPPHTALTQTEGQCGGEKCGRIAIAVRSKIADSATGSTISRSILGSTAREQRKEWLCRVFQSLIRMFT